MMHSIVRRVCGLLRCCSLHFHHQMGASDGDRLGVEQAQGVEDDIVVLTEEEAAAEAERLAQKVKDAPPFRLLGFQSTRIVDSHRRFRLGNAQKIIISAKPVRISAWQRQERESMQPPPPPPSK